MVPRTEEILSTIKIGGEIKRSAVWMTKACCSTPPARSFAKVITGCAFGIASSLYNFCCRFDGMHKLKFKWVLWNVELVTPWLCSWFLVWPRWVVPVDPSIWSTEGHAFGCTYQMCAIEKQKAPVGGGKSKRSKRHYDTPCSQVIPQPSTDGAQCRLTPQFWWEAVYSTWYDRSTNSSCPCVANKLCVWVLTFER